MKNTKLYPWTFYLLFKMKAILKPCDEIRLMLEKIGFSITEEMENFIFIKAPCGWKNKKIAQGSMTGIFDDLNRLRIKISHTNEITIIPRFLIVGPSGNCNNNEIEGFVLDRKYPDGHAKRFIFKKKRKLKKKEKYFNDSEEGSTPILLMKSVKENLERKYPDYQNPVAYWN